MSIFEMILNLLNPSTLHGQIIQGALQIAIWLQIFKFIKFYVSKHYSKSTWYLQAISKGDGEAEFQMLLIAVPQHSISAIFIWLGIYFNSLQFFSMGMLGEFAFEFIELYNILMAKYFYNNCPFKEEMVRSLIFHHLPGVLVIIPTNLYFGDNIYIQKIAFSLLAIAPLGCGFFIAFKTRNVRDLQQRGQFTVYFFICIVIMIIARFYWTPSLIIEFLFDGFMNLSFGMQIMFAFYGILINLFNVTFVIILCQRLYGFLYCNKCVDKKDESIIKKLKQSPKPMLIRCRSTPLFFGKDSSKKRN